MIKMQLSIIIFSFFKQSDNLLLKALWSEKKKNLSIKILKGFLDPKLNMETETITNEGVMKADLKSTLVVRMNSYQRIDIYRSPLCSLFPVSCFSGEVLEIDVGHLLARVRSGRRLRAFAQASRILGQFNLYFKAYFLI